MKQSLFHLMIVLILVGCQEPSLIEIDLSEEATIPRNYIVSYTKEKIVVDGLSSDASWDYAPYSELFLDIKGKEIPKYETKVKMLWDSSYLYVFGFMKEPHIWGDITEDDAVIFHNNDFEIFISPSGGIGPYGEIEINALGSLWDLLLDNPYQSGGVPITSWNIKGLQRAIHIEGSINNPEDIDSFWTVELAIPMSAMLELKKGKSFLPKEGELWRINFSRVEWDFELRNNKYYRKRNQNGKLLPENNWVWSPQYVVNMHVPEKWGYLQFSTQEKTSNATKKIDPLLFEKQVAYGFYSNYRSNNYKELQMLNPGTSRNVCLYYSDQQFFEGVFYKNLIGYDLLIKLENSSKWLTINHKRVLSKYQWEN